MLADGAAKVLPLAWLEPWCKVAAVRTGCSTENLVTFFKGLFLFTDFKPGSGLTVKQLPLLPGLYAEVYWPERGLRIGESTSIRRKIRHDIGWIRAMHNGSADEKQLRRTTPITQAAKATGIEGFEF